MSPNHRSRTAGRLAHFDEELEKAETIRQSAIETLGNFLEKLAQNQDVSLDKIQQEANAISQSIQRNRDTLPSLTRFKENDAYSTTHSVNIALLVTAMALANGSDPSALTSIATASLLHNVGKVRLPAELLGKKDVFAAVENETMRQHVDHGEKLIREMGDFPEGALTIVVQHHERADGSGYPAALQGDQIHLLARLAAAADVYNALTTAKPYRPALTMHEALLHLYKNKGGEFAAEAVGCLIDVLGPCPVGSLIELKNWERGLVLEPNPEDPLRPLVGLITRPSQEYRDIPTIVDLAGQVGQEGMEIVKVLDPVRVGMDDTQWMATIKAQAERIDTKKR